nr:MAG TPA: hypothetical protein [Caudoviricetes sp.]
MSDIFELYAPVVFQYNVLPSSISFFNISILLLITLDYRIYYQLFLTFLHYSKLLFY